MPDSTSMARIKQHEAPRFALFWLGIICFLQMDGTFPSKAN
ncbi:hypothetical protein CEV31_2472 [Brucella thiophenivorans]|uniref:Uncharacterized protein n=1 Tax=Brucella thiophenivorans TaxID=571255 RepID=A0A256FWJ8_9HYPH|nr:hypothetical protein CEV31_2472 [Brucella thiophenivorans]